MWSIHHKKQACKENSENSPSSLLFLLLVNFSGGVVAFKCTQENTEPIDFMLHRTGLIDLLQATFACQTFQGCFALLSVLYFLFLTEHKTNCKITAGWTGKQILC